MIASMSFVWYISDTKAPNLRAVHPGISAYLITKFKFIESSTISFAFAIATSMSPTVLLIVKGISTTDDLSVTYATVMLTLEEVPTSVHNVIAKQTILVLCWIFILFLVKLVSLVAVLFLYNISFMTVYGYPIKGDQSDLDLFAFLLKRAILKKRSYSLCEHYFFNPFMPNGLFYLNSLDRSISHIIGVWLVFIIFMFNRNYWTKRVLRRLIWV